MKFTRFFVIVCMLSFWTVGCMGLGFIRSYAAEGEVITKVNTVRVATGWQTLLAVEGYYPLTGSFFSNFRCLDEEGYLTDAYQDATVGQPLRLGAGVFESRYSMAVLVPTIAELPSHRFCFNWQRTYNDHTEFWEDNGFLLPDSLDSIYEFPTAMSDYSIWAFDTQGYLSAGRARVNGIYRSFGLDMWEYEGSVATSPFFYIPALQHVTGLVKASEGSYLAIGQSNGWTGTALLISAEGNLLWQQNFSDGADGSQTPMFTTPLLSKSCISYQDRDRVLHIARYTDQSLQTIYSEQLDGYIGAAPLLQTDSLLAFAYLKNGVQYLKQIDMTGRVIWSRQLPGTGALGKYCLSETALSPLYFRYYLIGGSRADGSFYLAKVRMNDGRVDDDEITQPAQATLKAYPNPCHEQLQVTFELKSASPVTLSLYNLKGQKVIDLLSADLNAGTHQRYWIISPWLPSLKTGMYLLRLKYGDRSLTSKVLIYP